MSIIKFVDSNGHRVDIHSLFLTKNHLEIAYTIDNKTHNELIPIDEIDSKNLIDFKRIILVAELNNKTDGKD